MVRFLVMALVLAVPAAASADSLQWFTAPNGASPIGVLDPNVESTRVAYFESDETSGNSWALDTKHCNPAIFTFNPDEDGALTGAEVNLWDLDGPSAVSTTNNGRKIQPDTDGDGVPNDVTFDGTSTGRKSIQFRSSLILVEIATNATPDEFRVKVECK